MGNASAAYYAYNYDSWVNPEVNPSPLEKPKNDPNFGFQNERETRVNHVSEEDMYWAKIPPNKRDYCAHHLIDLARCRVENFPIMSRCRHFKHEWDSCQFEDTVFRMKEYERERRLLKREQRIKKTQEKEANHA